jgi:glycosyltransferase involved in cell wall biosynthesis
MGLPMHRGLTISVVIPCYNEQEGIKRVIGSMPPQVDEIVVVDNNSTDATADVARNLGAVVVREPKQGYGYAYQAGLPLATGDIIATADGDGTYPTHCIPMIIDYLLDRDLDFVSACRFPLKDRRSMHLRNVLGNKLLTLAMNALHRVSVKDALSGMWVFRRHCLGKMKLTSGGMPFTEEIKIEAILHPQLEFGEYHIPYSERIGHSKLAVWRDGARMLLFLLERRLRR